MISRVFLSLFLTALLLSLGTAPGEAQTTIFVSRHTDREGTEPDPSLTVQGQRQAAALAVLLADAKITHIFTTELLRTRQTAAPTAEHCGVTPEVVPQKNFEELIAKIRSTARSGEAMLVVGHRATVPRIVKALSGQEITPLGSGEYSRLIAITLFSDGKTNVVTLRNVVP